MGEYEALVEQYRKMKKEQADVEAVLEILDEISKCSYDEQLMFEWALWYWKAEYPARANRVAKKMLMYFRDGIWAERMKQVLERLDEDEDFPPEMEHYLTEDVQAADAKEKAPEKNQAEEIPPVISEAFRGMVGMESVKRELISFYNIARLEKLREQQLGISGNDSRSYNFVLYGNPGTGKTTVARIIGKVLYALGIRENDTFVEADRAALVSQYVGETSKNVKKILSDIRGGTLFIDEAYDLYRKDDGKDFGQDAINTLLKDMEDRRSEYSVIMAGYRTQMTEMLNNANPGFRSRFTYHIDIPDYTDEELLEIAKNIAENHHYKIDEKGFEALKKRIDKERMDETFGNARFIREVINEAEKNLANRLVKLKTFDQEALVTLKAEDIFPEDLNHKGLDELLSELNRLVGLKDVKKSVQDLLDKILIEKEMEKRGIATGGSSQSMHMSFKGNAGTGKTTVARLLGKILNEMGVLKRGNVFVEVTRADLVGMYQGHTAAKVKEVVRSAMGGVLFIDEAYALIKDAGDTFGREAVDTLVAEMENHRDSLIVILAGYTADIDRFLNENQGLRSRVTRDLFFEDYTVCEMVEIFKQQAKAAKLILSDEVYEDIRARLEKEIAKEENFGNGRGVRNVFESVCRAKDGRVAAMLRSGQNLSDEDFVTITKEDIESA